MKGDYAIPSVVKENCAIYSNESGKEGVRMDIYKWSGTDRVTIQWTKTKGSGGTIIGKMDMHYTELYDNLSDLLADRFYLTEVMAEQGWGVLDIRDLQRVREFDENFF